MARYRDAKCKLCRRAGEKLFLKGDRCYSNKCAIEKRNFPPGQHGKSRHGKSSKYNMQLREKQKLRQHYGLLEQLLFKQVRHRKAQLPPGPARQVAAREVIEVQHAAAREAEASPALRTARTAVIQTSAPSKSATSPRASTASRGTGSHRSTTCSCARSRSFASTTDCSNSSSGTTSTRRRPPRASRVRPCCSSWSAVWTTSCTASVSRPRAPRLASSSGTATSR